MTKATNVARVAAAVAGFGLVAMSFAPLAGAQTTTTTTTTATTTMMATFSRNLTIGSTGTDVTALQTWLMAKGYSIPAGATGYFGAQTKAALAAYQAASGISPAAGYFGPITRAAVMAAGTTTGTTSTVPGCMAGAMYSSTTGQACGTSTTTTGGSTSTTLMGGEGSIDNFKTVGATNTSLNQADSDQVLGFEFKANGSDLMVNRVDFRIVNTGTTGTLRPWGVFQTATLMNGNTTVGTIDLTNQANFSQDGTDSVTGNQVYRIRFDSLSDVVKMGSTADYYLTLSTQNSISNTNAGGTYRVSLPFQGVRAVDAKGIQQYAPGAAINSTVITSNTSSGSVVLSTGSDNPQTTTVQGDSNTSTSGVTLNTFTLQAKDSDVVLYSLPVRVSTTTSSASNVIRTLKLYQGSTLLDTESVAAGAGATTTFQNLNVKITQGTTLPFKIVAEINKVDGSNFSEGAGIVVTVPGTGIDVENGSNTVAVTGSAVGNTISFRSIGLSIDASPTSTNATATSVGTSGTQQGNFTYVFNVMAFGQDVFFSKTGPTAITGQIFDNNGATSTIASSTAINSTADTTSGNNYVVHSGQTKQVTVTVTVPNGTNASVYSKLTNFKFGTLDSAPAASSTPFNNNYQTASVYLHS